MTRTATLVMLLAVPFIVLVSGCMDADPFGLSGRRIAGKYHLEQFESGDYYILKDGHEGSGGGFIDGTVLEIGWNAETIAAKRHSNVRGEGDGWMIIVIESDEMTGPLSDEEFRKSYPSIETYEAKTAWTKLGDAAKEEEE